VDNGSKDDSIEKIKEYAEGNIEAESKFFEYSDGNKPIKIIEYKREEAEAGGGKEEEIADLPSNRKLIIIKNEKNYGFADGNNIGMRYALKALNPDYVLLLNNDTVVDKDFLSHLVEFMKKNQDVGICNSLQYSYYQREIILAAGVNFSKFGLTALNAKGLKNPIFKRPFETTYASGACIFVRKSLLSELGVLDEKMFIGAEDIDISLRCWIKGKKVIVVPNSVICHKHHISVEKKPTHWIIYYGIRSISRCLLKNFQLRTLLISLPFFLSLQFGSLMKDLIIRRDFKMADARIKAIVWNLINLRDTLIERKSIQMGRVFPDSRFLNNQDWRKSFYS